MSDAQKLASLLEVARSTLRSELATALDEAGRYRAAMVGNAIAIAARALNGEGEPARQELAALQRLYPDHAQADLDGLRRRLARDIRAGCFDGAGDRLARAVLRVRVETRLAISNPQERL